MQSTSIINETPPIFPQTQNGVTFWRQALIPPATCYLNSIDLQLSNDNAGTLPTSLTYDFYIMAGTYTSLTQYYYHSQLQQYFSYSGQVVSTTIVLPSALILNQTISQNTSYYFLIKPYSNNNPYLDLILVKDVTSNLPNYQTGDGYNFTNGWSGYTYYCGFYFSPLPQNGSYFSAILNAGSSWGSWGTISINDNKPTGTTINYYAITSSSVYNIATNTPQAIANSSLIPSQNGKYIQIISSFSVVNSTAVCQLNSFNIAFYGSNNSIPCSIVYKDRYYLAVSTTSGTTPANDTVLIYDSVGNWTKHSGFWGSACLFHQYLYTGDSTQGLVYQQDVPNVYTDNGGSYLWKWTSKIFDMKEQDAMNTFRVKDYYELWTLANSQTSGNISAYYRLDASNNASDWTLLDTISLVDPYGLGVTKSVFQAYPHSEFIQVLYQGNSACTLKGYAIVYKIEPRQ